MPGLKQFFAKHYVDPESQNLINTADAQNLIKNYADQENKADRLQISTIKSVSRAQYCQLLPNS